MSESEVGKKQNLFWEIHQVGVSKVKQWAEGRGHILVFDGHQFVDLIFQTKEGKYLVVEVKTLKAKPKAKQREVLGAFKALGAETTVARYDIDRDDITFEAV